MRNNQNSRLRVVLALAVTLICAPLSGQTDVGPDKPRQDKPRQDKRGGDAKPLYLHWFKPYYAGNKSAPMHIMTLRVTPSTDFEVHFRDPGFKSRKCSIKGRIDERDGQYTGSVQCIWKSGTAFDHGFELESPHKGRPLGYASAYHHTHIVLSHNRSAEPFLSRRPQK